MRVRDRWLFYRERGLDVAGRNFRGALTPELVRALNCLHDALVVSDVMEAPVVYITLEVPPELEADLHDALKS